VFAGMPHDGMMILNQLVDWKVGWKCGFIIHRN